MMPASQAATTKPPIRGRNQTISPAAISTTPTMSMAWWDVPGMMLSNCGAR